MTGPIVLVLGGTRSGKSVEAEAIITRLADGEPVTYFATARSDGTRTFDQRITIHRNRRPRHWRTIEIGDPSASNHGTSENAGPDRDTSSDADHGELADQLRKVDGPVLLDALGPWVATHLDQPAAFEQFLTALHDRQDPTVIVSDEVGLAVHPPTEIGRRFVDAIGALNQQIASIADEVRLVIAGRVLDLPRSPEPSPSPPAPPDPPRSGETP